MTEQRTQSVPEGRELDPRLIKAISHPLRYRLLVRLHLGEASPVAMARELGELVRTVPRRGAVEHFYRPIVPAWFTDGDWELLPPTTRRAIVGQNVHGVVTDVAAAAQTGFERRGCT